MRRVLIFTIAIGLVITAPGMSSAVELEISPAKAPALSDNLLEPLLKMYSEKALEENTYVGDEYCIACHSWGGVTRDTKHRQALRTPMGANSLVAGRGVVADYDRNGVDDFMQGLDFNTISSAFDPYKPNAPILSYDGATDTYYMSIAGLMMPVVVTQGGTGDWKQRYLLAIPASGVAGGYAKDNYVSPMQFNEKTYEYVLYHPEHWWDADGTPTYSGTPTVSEVASIGRSYNRRCIGCHTTGFRELFQDSNNEWIYRPYPASLPSPEKPEQYPDYDRDGIPDIVNIGCEACHGPGGAHVLGGGDPNEILAPSSLDTPQANELCEQCHVRTSSTPNGTFGYPYRDDVMESWVPGRTEAPLKDYYEEHAGLWPDGKTSRQHHQQYEDLYKSSKPEFQFHPIKCVECHSAHSARQKHQIVTRIVDEGLTIATSNDNNTLCLACHATHGEFEEITKEQVAEYEENLDHIENVVAAHTNHPYAPERSMGLSRCSKCHMPKTAKSAINYDIHGHTFEVIAPEKTVMYQEDGGMPNSCAVSCHSMKVNSFGYGLDPNISDWSEAFDVHLAEALGYFFGPGGIWWDTDHETNPKSATRRHLDEALPPGSIQEPIPDVANE